MDRFDTLMAKLEIIESKLANIEAKISSKKKEASAPAEGYDSFIEEYNRVFSRKTRGDAKSKSAFSARIKDGYTLNELILALSFLFKDEYHKEKDYKYATPEFILRSNILERYLSQQKVVQKKIFNTYE